MQIQKIVFMGTPQFAVPTLEALAKTRFKPILCITQPDKPKGRKRKLQPTEVKLAAQKIGIPVIQPEDVNSEEILNQLNKLQPDVIITAAYGGYLKKNIRLLPKFGCLNLHPSLLPKYRGSAPINFTLFNGDSVTGNTIFKIVAKMDAGPILFQSKLQISEDDCYTTLYKKLSKQGAEDIIKVLEKLETEQIIPMEQDHEKATFSHKLHHEDFLLDWNNTAANVRNKVRGLAEIPGITASFRGARIKIIEIDILETKSQSFPGTIIEVIKNKGLRIATSDFDVLIKRLQPAGKKIMTAHAFSLGARIENDEKFENGF
ncbi:MAG: methionyl-tRNA formyltransferase [Candidatus Cloacimonadota bacterium]|nr:MAG: methionyl-tRNA formyltransferase [Candidatus Cloacimonadota bacterium]